MKSMIGPIKIRATKIAPMVLALALCAGLIIIGCSGEKPEDEAAEAEAARKDRIVQTFATPSSDTAPAPDTAGYLGERGAAAGIPRMIDLGKGTCVPCRKMAPILKELKQKYEGRAVIEFIDLDDDKGAARRYGIRLMPTQIFFDADGVEIWRHEGFLSRAAIIGKFEEMGVEPPPEMEPVDG